METNENIRNNGASVSSYRTYEEWKLFHTADEMSMPTKFLPYLWGMETLEG